MDLKEKKKSIRLVMKRLRAEISISDYRKWSYEIEEKCRELLEYRTAFNVHIYVSAVNNEVDTLGLILRMFDERKRVAVPKCDSDSGEIVNIEITSLDELSPGHYGTMEPPLSQEKIIKPETLDLVIAPLLAFDRNGGRLGFGGGYYDRLIAKCKCPVVGLAYSFQEINAVPSEKHDRKLNVIVTEKEIIRIKNG